MTKVVVTVGEKELSYEFTEIWQIKLFVKFLNWYVKLLDWWFGISR